MGGISHSNYKDVHVCICVYEKAEFFSNSVLSTVLRNLTDKSFVLFGPGLCPSLKPKGQPSVHLAFNPQNHTR